MEVLVVLAGIIVLCTISIVWAVIYDLKDELKRTKAKYEAEIDTILRLHSRRLSSDRPGDTRGGRKVIKKTSTETLERKPRGSDAGRSSPSSGATQEESQG